MPLPREVWQTILRDPYFELVLIEDKRLATDQANIEARWGCEPITDGYDLETLDMCQTIVPRIIENAMFGMFVGKLVCAKHPRSCGCEACYHWGQNRCHYAHAGSTIKAIVIWCNKDDNLIMSMNYHGALAGSESSDSDDWDAEWC